MKTPFEEWNEDSFDLTGEFEVVDSMLNLRSGGLIANSSFAARTKRILAAQEMSRTGCHPAYDKMRAEEYRAAEKIRLEKQRQRELQRKEAASRAWAENPNRVDYNVEIVQTEPTFNEFYGFTPDPVTHTPVTMRDKRVTRGCSNFTVNGVEFLYGTAPVLTKNKSNILAAVGKNIIESDYRHDSKSIVQLLVREYKEFTMAIIRSHGKQEVKFRLYGINDCSLTFRDIKTMWPIISEFFPAATLTENALYANYSPE